MKKPADSAYKAPSEIPLGIQGRGLHHDGDGRPAERKKPVTVTIYMPRVPNAKALETNSTMNIWQRPPPPAKPPTQGMSATVKESAHKTNYRTR